MKVEIQRLQSLGVRGHAAAAVGSTKAYSDRPFVAIASSTANSFAAAAYGNSSKVATSAALTHMQGRSVHSAMIFMSHAE